MGLLTLSALCLLSVLISSSFSGAEAESCDRDWLQDQDSCYGVFEENATWAEAEIRCQTYGQRGHLASIDNKAVSSLLSDYIKNFLIVPRNVWIGLRDYRRNRRWIWSDGSPYNYKAWMENEPNNVGNSEYCVELKQTSDFKEWNDAYCENLNFYICKHEI